jgi:hypothetical protein
MEEGKERKRNKPKSGRWRKQKRDVRSLRETMEEAYMQRRDKPESGRRVIERREKPNRKKE